MIIKLNTYVPALKWRQSEYQALFRLSDAAKARICPFIMVPAIEFDFEDNEPKKTVQEHIAPFAKRFKDKWKGRPAWVEVDKSLRTQKMDSGVNVVGHVFTEVRKLKATAVPVAALDCEPDALTAVAAAVEIDGRGVAVRARLEDLMKPSFNKQLGDMLVQLGVSHPDVDLIVDLGAPAYEPYNIFSKALAGTLAKVQSLEKFRSFVIMGTAFPESFQNVAVPGGVLPRHDWLFYKEFVATLPKTLRRPAYGDYSIVSPTFVANFDMRLVKPAGKVVYTTPNEWVVRKGGAFRDNRTQMHGHCAHIVKLPSFCGAGYSSGDEYIARCAKKEKDAGPSTLGRWKEVGISHHIMHVLADLATLGG